MIMDILGDSALRDKSRSHLGWNIDVLFATTSIFL